MAWAQQGLTSDYWENLAAPAAPGIPAGAPTRTAVVPVVDHTDGAAANPPYAFVANPLDQFFVRFHGFVQAPVTGTVTFRIYIDDRGQLTVNGTTIITSWIDQGPTYYQGTIDLVQGEYYPIEFQFYENGGGARAQLLWSYTGQAEITVPNGALFVTAPAPPAPVLTAATPGDQQVTLTWTYTGPPTASGFNIYQVNGMTYTLVGQTGGTTFTVTGLPNNVSYTFVVRAVSSGVESADSNAMAATPAPPPARYNDHEEGTEDRNCSCGSAGVGGLPALLGAGVLLLALLTGFRR
jgi:hypothetical protein